MYIKTGDICKDFAKDVKTKFDSPNNELNRPLPKRKKKKSYWCNER